MSIILDKLRVTPRQLVQAIVLQDTVFYNSDSLRSIEILLPTVQERKATQRMDYPDEELQPLGLFLRELVKVGDLKPRCAVAVQMLEAREVYDRGMAPLKAMTMALDSIISSTGLQKSLGVLLAVGNFMNGGTKFGSAAGIDATWIAKVGDTRSTSGHSIIECICRIMRTRQEFKLYQCSHCGARSPLIQKAGLVAAWYGGHPHGESPCPQAAAGQDPRQCEVLEDYSEFHKGLTPLVSRAQRIDPLDLENIYAELIESFKSVQRAEVQEPAVEELYGDQVEDRFHDSCVEYLKRWGPLNDNYKAKLDALHLKVEELQHFFCLPGSKELPPGDILGSLTIFLLMYGKAYTIEEEKQKLEERRARFHAKKEQERAANHSQDSQEEKKPHLILDGMTSSLNEGTIQWDLRMSAQVLPSVIKCKTKLLRLIDGNKSNTGTE